MNPVQLDQVTIQQALKALPFKALHNFYPQELLDGEPRPAAVLIPLVRQGKAWHVLFIRRTEVEGDMHSGQVALPGGKRDRADESLSAAALRETNEELGIRPEDIHMLGRLNEFIAISNFRVTPFVGTLPWPYNIQIDPREVARWFTVPLAWLADSANRQIIRRELPNGLGEVGVIYFDEYDGEILWGLSARIIIELLEALGLESS
jgi:8-oxo-dGTP pyrophosphatase MutT (NUDIX family)